MNTSKKKTYYVYHNGKLIEVLQTFTEEGAKDWTAAMHNLPAHELMATIIKVKQ